MYAEVLACEKLGEKDWMVELKIDQPGLKANTTLSSQRNNERWKVESRVLYSHFRGLHKRFDMERIKVIRLEIPVGDIDKLKLDLCERENAGIFQYIIKGNKSSNGPVKGERLLCAGY